MQSQTGNGQDSEPLAWAPTQQHCQGHIPTTFSTSYSEKVSKYHRKRKNCQELSNFLYYSFYFLLAAWNRTLTIACNTVLHTSAGTRTSEACCRLCKQRSQEPCSGRDSKLFPTLNKIWTFISKHWTKSKSNLLQNNVNSFCHFVYPNTKLILPARHFFTHMNKGNTFIPN